MCFFNCGKKIKRVKKKIKEGSWSARPKTKIREKHSNNKDRLQAGWEPDNACRADLTLITNVY